MSPNESDIMQRLKAADVYLQQGLLEEAIGIYKPLLSQCRETLIRNIELSNTERLKLRSVIRSLESRLERIEIQTEATEGSLGDAHQISSDLSAETLLNRGIHLSSNGFFDDAILELEKAAEKAPDLSVRCLEEIAKACLAKGDAEAGIQELRRALSLVKENPEKEAELLEHIAGIQEQIGNEPEALATYKEIFLRHGTYSRIFRKIEELSAKLSRSPLNLGIVCRYPKLFFTGALILGLFFITFNPWVKTVNDFDFYTLENSPELEFYDTFKAVFGNDEFFIIAFENDDLFSSGTLETIQNITFSLEELEDVEKVTSLANVDEITGGEDYFEVHAFLEDLPQTEEDRETLKQNALQNPLYTKNLISTDGRTTAIVVEPFVRPHDENLRKRLLSAVEEILSPYKEAGQAFYLAGWTTTNYSLGRYLTSDVHIFIPATYLFITFFTWLFFRNFRITLLSILSISICVGATRGLMGLLGIDLNNVTIIIIPLVMALALCDTAHIFSHMDLEVLKRFPRSDLALSHVLNRVALPCFLTTLTTAIGFISLSISEILPVRQFGLVASAGMVFEFIFSFFFLPPLILYCDPQKIYQEYSGGNRISTVLRHLFSLIYRGYPFVLAGSVAIIIASIVYTSQLRVETNLMEFFKKSSPIRTALDFVENHLSGVATLDISFKASEADGFKNPENLKVIEAVQTYAQTLPAIDKAVSFVDFIKDMNQSFHSEDPDFFKIPDSRELVSQYLLLYDADDIEDFINLNFDHARLSLRTSRHSSIEQRSIIENIQEFINSMDSGGLDIQITGRSLKSVLVIDALVKSQVYSLVIATMVISVLLLIVFRSAALASLSLIPNMFPILINFGIMGAVGIPLDTGTALIAAVALGIAVDDTIHFLSEYQQRRAQGLLVSEAIMHVIDTKGRAIVSSSLILCIGFGVMVFSRFVPVIHFGLLCAIIMITALIGDIVLLPAVILLKKEKT